MAKSRYTTTTPYWNTPFEEPTAKNWAPLVKGTYPGSSGSWMNSPSPNYGGNAPAIPGFGYPGDAARSRYGVPTLDPSFRPNNPVGGDINFPDGSGGQQSNRLTELKSRYDRGEIPFEQLF